VLILQHKLHRNRNGHSQVSSETYLLDIHYQQYVIEVTGHSEVYGIQLSLKYERYRNIIISVRKSQYMTNLGLG